LLRRSLWDQRMRNFKCGVPPITMKTWNLSARSVNTVSGTELHHVNDNSFADC